MIPPRGNLKPRCEFPIVLAPLTGPATRASLAPPGHGLWLSCPAALRDGMIETRTIYVGLIGVSLLHADALSGDTLFWAWRAARVGSELCVTSRRKTT